MNLNEYARECHAANLKWWQEAKPCPTCSGKGTYTTTVLRGQESGLDQYIQHRTPQICEECNGVGHRSIQRNFGELIALCHSELSEALEGHRKNLMDDKLPHRNMAEVELADCLIRIFDLADGLGMDLQGAYTEKMAYNAQRADHKHENRVKAGGKAY